MSLSSDLISQFVKVTKDEKQTKTETVVFGNIVYDDRPYVKLDGSDQLTPVTTTADVHDGERVTVMIKDHTATVTGNVSSPAARTDDVKEVADDVSEFEIVMSYRVTTEDLEASNATIESLRAKVAKFDSMQSLLADIYKLQADFAELEYVDADTVKALNAEIDYLEAEFGKFTDVSTEDLAAMYAEIDVLRGYTADYTYVSADVLHAVKASIDNLDVGGLTVEEADIRYANIDFSNIGEAAMENFYANSGLIEDVVIGDGTITGHLVGVTIKGDLIEGGTVIADKLVIQGDDGLYYKLNTDGVTTETEQTDYNSLNGSVITAKSITATKISVDDLVAFDATIGGFNITENALYSGVKESVDNTTAGIYLDKEGQAVFGDETNFVKFYKDKNGAYKLEISADEFIFSSSKESIESAITSNASALNEKISQQAIDAEAMCNDIVDTKLEGYVDKDTHKDLENTVANNYTDLDSRLSVLPDRIDMAFSKAVATDGQYKELSRYITFGTDGITIGNPVEEGSSKQNKLTLHLDNTGIIFRKGPQAMGRWDGENFYTGNIVVALNEVATFGNFSYKPEKDGSLSFRLTNQTDMVVVTLSNNVLSIKNTDSLINSNTSIICDVRMSLTNRILTLEV